MPATAQRIVAAIALALAAGSTQTVACAQSPAISAPLPLERIRLPQGFAIDLVARVPHAREMAFGRHGTLFVGSADGAVHALTFAQAGARGAVTLRTIATGLRDPIGVAWRDGALYVSAVSRILRYDAIDDHLDAPPAPATVTDAFPREGHHGRKFIAFGPDGRLYVPVGAPCNVCAPDPSRYANIQRLDADGSRREVVARGVRDSVGFDWDPVTGDLWFTDNGRDWLGDDVPPDELNHVTAIGQDFGFPYCHGGTIADPGFGSGHPCSAFVAPAQRLGPHVAALGMRFYTGTQFPADYRNQIFIAEHGSWNRSHRIGYRVTLVRLDRSRHPVAYEPFATGWLVGAAAWGRPADVAVAPDGSLFVSDDHAGAIYRIRYVD
ncbi:MAG: PQQ-dependent sugar dehydrogenase [Proteobacteria bacterium]|nr:PQQ-dependent sugar dehydrogenase [Pseudomonadota bacterium]